MAARGYAVLGRDVDFGTPKRPDFLIQTGAHEVVVEVKTFDRPTISHSAPHSGFVARDLGPVRLVADKASGKLARRPSSTRLCAVSVPGTSWANTVPWSQDGPLPVAGEPVAGTALAG